MGEEEIQKSRVRNLGLRTSSTCYTSSRAPESTSTARGRRKPGTRARRLIECGTMSGEAGREGDEGSGEGKVFQIVRPRGENERGWSGATCVGCTSAQGTRA